MRNPLTTRDQEFHRELMVKEAYARLAWKIKVTLPPVVPQRHSPVQEAPPLKAPPLMRPVTPLTSGHLYRGLSSEGNGRQLYLKKRAQKPPEDKFDHPVLSSWDYGWRLGDFGIECKTPANGRMMIVRNTFYSKNGIFHLPSATDQLG